MAPKCRSHIVGKHTEYSSHLEAQNRSSLLPAACVILCLYSERRLSNVFGESAYREGPILTVNTVNTHLLSPSLLPRSHQYPALVRQLPLINLLVRRGSKGKRIYLITTYLGGTWRSTLTHDCVLSILKDRVLLTRVGRFRRRVWSPERQLPFH